MALLHQKSAECTLAELDLFSAPMTQLSVEDKKYQEYQPLSALSDSSPIEFYIPGDGEKYLDLNDTLLHLRVKITEKDGSNIPPDTAVGLINYPLNTIFSQCDVILGDRLISQSSATHPYRAIIETLLNFSDDTLKSQFSAGLFYKDSAGAMDSVVINNGPNRGLVQRGQFSAESAEVDLLGPLHSDIFFCERLMLNSVDLRIKLIRNNDAFCLMGLRDSEFCLKIISASLFVKKVTVSPAVRLGHAAALMKGNALYPLSRVCVKTYSIPENSRICNQENLFLGAMPRYLALAMVRVDSFSGRRDLSPLTFFIMTLNILHCVRMGGSCLLRPSSPVSTQAAQLENITTCLHLLGDTSRICLLALPVGNLTKVILCSCSIWERTTTATPWRPFPQGIYALKCASGSLCLTQQR